MVHEIEQKVFQEMMGTPDWSYRDLPKMPPELFQEFCDVAGSENLKWITTATYEIGGKKLRRGQVMISPKGLQNMQQFILNMSK